MKPHKGNPNIPQKYQKRIRQPHQKHSKQHSQISLNSYLDGIHGGGGGGDHLVKTRKGGLIQAKSVVELAEHLLAGHLYGEEREKEKKTKEVML